MTYEIASKLPERSRYAEDTAHDPVGESEGHAVKAHTVDTSTVPEQAEHRGTK